ncbi:Site-specific recombinase XerD [Rhodospira trueperi]|uniref:Site-specific recombinase XerD n=2 Tax=Rhodospira trueperi TaxID=69960 RepID=A0A1G7H3Q2_9PROT|nr:Site-specific recombinase XerD [Rhodospira trueperi]
MDPEHPEFEEQPEVKDGRRFYGIATAQVVKTADMAEEWLATKGNLRDKQRDMYRSDLRRFSERFPYVEDVTRRAATQWVNDLMAGPDGLSQKTVQRILAAVRGYWRHLENMEVVPAEFDPFKGLAKGSKGSSNGQRGSRFDRWRVFEPDDVVRLLRAAEAKGDAKLAEVIRLGMWTGCRIEELCSLKVENVHDGHFEVIDAKTEAGWREVPIHSRLAPIMAELVKASKDGFVVSGLTRNKYGDRSNAVGKRFGRLKTALGFEERFVFHSIRKTVVTQLERAGVPENVAADIVGHDKPTMTYGTYGNRNRLETLKEAVELLAYDDGTPGFSPQKCEKVL